MTGEEFVLSIVAMVMGSGVLIVGIAKITDLIKTWINRDESYFSDEEFSRLAKAFMEHKNEMERRVKNLEAIAAGGDDESVYPELDEHPEEESMLSNDLRKKRRVR